jgi:hypothetical protein
MRQIAYALQFRRPAKTPNDPNPRALAPSAQFTSVIGPAGVTAQFAAVPGETAELQNGWALNKDGSLFFEWGKIIFGTSGNVLEFSSVGTGYVLSQPSPIPGFLHGTVMWKVEKGAGALEGATGAIVSNFLANPATDELIDNQFHLLFLP